MAKLGSNYGKFVLVPEGEQNFKIEKVEIVPKGKPKTVKVTFVHPEGGRIIQDYDINNEGAMYHLTMVHLAATQKRSKQIETDDMIGKFVKLLIVHNTGNTPNEETGEYPVFANIKKALGQGKPFGDEDEEESTPVDDGLDDDDLDEELDDDLDDDLDDEDDLPD